MRCLKTEINRKLNEKSRFLRSKNLLFDIFLNYFWIIAFILTAFLLSYFLNNRNVDIKYIKAEVVKVQKVDNLEQVEKEEDEGFSQEITIKTSNDENLEIVNDYAEVEKGQNIFIEKIPETEDYRVVEINRIKYLWIFFILFLIIIFAFMGLEAIKSILSLVISIAIIFFVLIPAILSGWNILLISIITTIIILAIVMFFTHGLNRKTSAAYIRTIITIVVTGALSYIAVRVSSFSGLSSESAFNLYMMGVKINFSDLLLSGILIGIIRILDDVAITQAVLVEELKALKVDSKDIYQKAMRVGKEHVGALVNTIVLAYLGAFFPLVIWFYSLEESTSFLMSKEVVASEILRVLIGTIGLILTVPIVTIISIFLIKEKK